MKSGAITTTIVRGWKNTTITPPRIATIMRKSISTVTSTVTVTVSNIGIATVIRMTGTAATTGARLALLLLLGGCLFMGGCNALCFASTDPDIWGQKGDDMNNPAWYAEPACAMADFLP
jgi:hypothetical protein